LITKTQRQWGIAMLVIVVLGLGGFFLRHRAGSADKDDEAISAQSPATQNGSPVLQMKAATQARIGLRTEVLTSESLKPELTAYGKLEEDPARSFILRAPISGTLHYAPGRDWPGIGEHLADGAVIGIIEPRFTPAERISLSSQLATVQSEVRASAAAVTAAKAAYERARILNADNKNVSDQVLQDASSRLQAEEARYQAAGETVQQIQTALKALDPTGSRRLIAERGGEIVELIAQPGESIEPGSPILRVAKLDHLLARINIPVGQHVLASVSTARIVPVGFENEPIFAKRIAVAPAVDPRIQGEAFLFRLNNSQFGLRPGVAVTAYLDLPESSQPGVVIPQAAIVRFQGSGFAYVQTATGEFVRRQVSLDHPTQTGYFATDNFRPGDRVVVAGAQSLLSEEFNAQVADID
jgi:RND family efflux transporter MFP subunit